jgi:hypothetical protein
MIGLADVNPYVALPWAMVVIALLSGCFVAYTMWAGRAPEESAFRGRLFASSLLLLFTLRLLVEVIVNDRRQYDAGTKQLASLLREQQTQRVIYLGKDLNPALDLYLKGWDTWKTDIRLDYYLSETTALAPKRMVIDLPRPGESTCLVEEKRIAGEEHFTNLPAIKDGVVPLFSNDTYFVYRLTSSK